MLSIVYKSDKMDGSHCGACASACLLHVRATDLTSSRFASKSSGASPRVTHMRQHSVGEQLDRIESVVAIDCKRTKQRLVDLLVQIAAHHRRHKHFRLLNGTFGSIEAREIPHGGADVIVSEAFVGNVILKLYEGVGATLLTMVKQGMMTDLRSKVGALLVKPALKQTLKSFDASQYGGAPLLGLKGLVVKTHGNSKRTEVKNSILQCVTFKEQRINEKIQESLNAAKDEEAGKCQKPEGVV